jgi:hypothetical protein
MFHNKQALMGIYANSSSGNQAQLIDFTVTTSSGDVLIEWGDGTSNILSSNVSISHGYHCPELSAPFSFWNNIEPCL